MSPPIAFVLLQQAAVPDLQALVDVLRQRHPDQPWAVDAPGLKRPRAPFILCGHRIVILLPVDAPVPNDESMWAHAAMSWPEARLAARHRAHVIVSLMGKGDDSVEDAKLVTAVVGGLIATASGACGVVFGGLVARSPQIWLEMSQEAFAPHPDYPIMLWIDIVPFRPGPQSVGAFTRGLSRFAGREIEYEVPGASSAPLIQRLAGLASYMVEHGDLVRDGDTIGEQQDERIEVHHGFSRFDGKPVLRIGPEPVPSGPLKLVN